jgi:hypothetical protein
MMMTMKNIMAFVCACALVGCAGGQRPVADTPDRRATREECEAAVQHVVTFPTEGLADVEKQALDAMRADTKKYVEQCTATAKRKDIECLMAAKTMTELGNCPPPGQ